LGWVELSEFSHVRKKMDNQFREIFVAVTGLTPQVITETIYALSQKKLPIIIDEICIITTATGKKVIEDTLIKKDILGNLIAEYDLKPIEITDNSFVIAKDENGLEISDIISEKDNEIIGDVITSTVRRLASDSNTRLHCSIAGGRKTMSFYLGAALQLFGRPQDRLYHVLVHPDFESNLEFFYKPKKNKIIEVITKDGNKRLNTKDAWIQIAELPFIRLGGKLSLKGKNFKELVEEGQTEIDTATTQPELTINLYERTVKIGKNKFLVPPVQLMIYTAFSRQKITQCIHKERKYCLHCTDCFIAANDLRKKEIFESIIDDYLQMYHGKIEKKEELRERWNNLLAPSDIVRQNISKINKRMKEQIKDSSILPYYMITNERIYGGTRYGIRLEKSKIRIEKEDKT